MQDALAKLCKQEVEAAKVRRHAALVSDIELPLHAEVACGDLPHAESAARRGTAVTSRHSRTRICN